jgi:hypothetical protein
MQQFLRKLLQFTAIGMTPVMMLFVLYLITDPFKTLRTYSGFSNYRVTPNTEYISFETFRYHNPEEHYNSFVFGSSRTKAFKTASWKKYLDSTAKPFIFNASAESLNGIYQKINFLNRNHYPIRNALIILCPDYLFYDAEHKEGYLFIKNPALNGESKLKYQFQFFKAFLNPVFLSSYIPYLITKQYRPYMHGYIENRTVLIDSITNEIVFKEAEDELKSKPQKYYAERKELFYERNGETRDSVSHINKENEAILLEIRTILEQNHTNYKVVISPLYDEIKFNIKDQQMLEEIFGVHLYDFSGKNAFSESKFNFYESSHYRPDVGDKILEEIYK